MKLLHIVPDSITDKRHYFLGSTKDVEGRRDYFRSRGIEYDELAPKSRSDERLLELLQKTDLYQYEAVIFEYPIYPKTLKYLKKHHRDIKLITRSHNAELFHKFHYALASFFKLKDLKRTWRHLKEVRDRAFQDFICALRSHSVLTISDWEKDCYWDFLSTPKQVKSAPYFIPSRYQIETTGKAKKNQCVCLMSTTEGTYPFQYDALSNLNHLIKESEKQLEGWEFLVTGDPLSIDGLSKKIEFTGFLDSPLDLLMESRVMALLSDFGFGFKTKILEAIHCKAYILLPKKLMRRLPDEVLPFCIVVDPKKPESFLEALRAAETPYPETDPNYQLRERAFLALDEVLCLSK